MPIFYHFRDITIHWRKSSSIRLFIHRRLVSFEALATGVPWDVRYENWYHKLESLGYVVVKTAWSYECLSSHGNFRADIFVNNNKSNLLINFRQGENITSAYSGGIITLNRRCVISKRSNPSSDYFLARSDLSSYTLKYCQLRPIVAFSIQMSLLSQ